MILLTMVYLVGLIGAVNGLLISCAIAYPLVYTAYGLTFIDCDKDEGCGFRDAVDKYLSLKTLWVLIPALVVIPSEDTAKYMVGAYALESVATSKEGEKIIDATNDALMATLKKWSKDSEDLKVLIQSAK